MICKDYCEGIINDYDKIIAYESCSHTIKKIGYDQINSIGFTNKPTDVKIVVILLGCNTVLSSFMTFYYSVYRAFEQMKFEAGFKMAFNALSVGMVIAVLAGHWQLHTFVVGTVLLTLINLIVLLRMLGRTHQVQGGAQIDLPFIRQTFRHAIPLALSTVFISIYFSLDTVMLSFWKDNRTVGWYTADYRIVLLIMTFVGLFYTATFPVISRLLNKDREAVRVILAMSLRIIVTLVLPATIAISLLAPQFIVLLFGESFKPGALALAILVWTVFLSGLSVVYSQTVLVSRHKVVYAIGTAIGAVLNTVLNFLLIPQWSLDGAAIATVVTELVLLVYFAIYCNRRVVNVPLEKRLIVPIALSLALIQLFMWSHSWPVHFLISGTAIGALYFVLLFATKSVTTHDITDVVRSLRSKESDAS